MNRSILCKFMSGRWLITVASTFVFVYLSINGILPIDRVMEIILIVIYAYFTKSRSNENGKNNAEEDEEDEEDEGKNNVV